MDSRTGTTGYTYDNLDRMTTVTSNGANETAYGYDANGRVQWAATVDENGVDYTYNQAGLLKSVTNSNGADFTYTYRLDGNRTQMTDSINGTVNYTYDGLGQLQTETTATQTTTYTYDTRGNRIGMNKGGIISQYTYDASNRLLSQVENVGGVNEQQTTYTYDNNGNLILRQMGQLSDSASQTESVALTGQTEQIPNTIEGASMVWYEYNAFGQLSGVSTDTGMQASYTYDATGRRASKTVNGVEKRHLWNGDRISAEADANDAITDTYFQLGGLSAHKTGDNLYYYLYDGHGSVVGMKNESQSGDATAMYNYDAFGNPLSDPMLTNPFRYCNEYYDAETDMIYLRNRYYDPSIGRFITEDPYWNSANMIYGENTKDCPNVSAMRQSSNLYIYCLNNPVIFVDPLGLYNRDAAVEFAKFYSINGYLYEKNYLRFDQDCTSFVSFCLKAGGMKASDDWYFYSAVSVRNPFVGRTYVKGKYSATWTLSNEQYEAFSNHSGRFPNTRYSDGEHICIHESKWIASAIKNYNIRPGDLLYFLNPETNEMGHTAIIVSTDKGRIIYAQHDDDKNNGDLGEYLDTHTKESDYNYVFVVKIRDDA